MIDPGKITNIWMISPLILNPTVNQISGRQSPVDLYRFVGHLVPVRRGKKAQTLKNICSSI